MRAKRPNSRRLLLLGAAALLAACGRGPVEQTSSPSTAGEPAAVIPETAAIEAAEDLIGLDFSADEEAQMQGELANHRAAYATLRRIPLGNDVAPQFVPNPAARICPAETAEPVSIEAGTVERPADLDALAYMTVAQLGTLIRSRQVSVMEVTEAFLARMRRYDPALEAVITLTEERALKQAAALDAELAAGHYRGPLHGIPYGAKDLFAVEGYPTTWGAAPYREQTIAATASVIERLDAAGAVLIAKLSMGALAWGDVWFGGRTRNPWNLEQGSSGSSAGPAAAVAAGLVPFALGTETWGSIVSPASRVGVTGLRPTFGRVSRRGAMALAWSMDKVGPLCRDAETCATVFAAIEGCDGKDSSLVSRPFVYPPQLDLAGLRLGYLAADFARDYRGQPQDLATLDWLREQGAELVPIALPDLPIGSAAFVLSVEAAAAFDELTRSNRDDLLVRQIDDAWPNVFRAARFVPAVEYVQASRLRTLLTGAMVDLFADIDAYVAPSTEGDNLLLTNLTGHPTVVVPNGFAADGGPTSISFIGRPYDEATLLALAARYQQLTGFHRRHPPGFLPSDTAATP
jgi:Asp-tRNA(Asn)/Glu-tRNA(Gln) amidotransferase A subunit family amidase